MDRPTCAATTTAGKPCRRPPGDTGLCSTHVRAGLPSPPDGLTPDAVGLWWSVLERWDLEPHELALLRETVRTLARCDLLAEVVAAEGLTSTGSKGQKVTHPAVAEVRQQQVVLGRLLAQLRLPEDEQEPASRPQRRGGFRGPQQVSPLRAIRGGAL